MKTFIKEKAWRGHLPNDSEKMNKLTKDNSTESSW